MWALLPEGTYVSRPSSQSWGCMDQGQGCSLLLLPCLCPSSWRATFMTRNRGLLPQICFRCNSRSHPQPRSKQSWDGWWCTGVTNHRQAEECFLGAGAFCIWISEARGIISSSCLTLLVTEARELHPVSPESPASCMWLTPQRCSAPSEDIGRIRAFPPLLGNMFQRLISSTLRNLFSVLISLASASRPCFFLVFFILPLLVSKLYICFVWGTLGMTWEQVAL